MQISRLPAAAGVPATRSRVLINGVASSLRVLRALGALLADVNGQHASLALRDAATQLQLLDRIAGGVRGRVGCGTGGSGGGFVVLLLLSVWCAVCAGC